MAPVCHFQQVRSSSWSRPTAPCVDAPSTRSHPLRSPAPPAVQAFRIDSSVLQKMKPDALILHPLPRTVELDKTVDSDPRALYFRQAANGLYVRMALLAMLLDT